MKIFSVVAAVSMNGVIGNSKTNSIPWHIPTDLKFFKSITMNKTIVMGSNTYESLGKPLRDRRNIVVTRSPEKADRFTQQGVDFLYPSFRDVYDYEPDDFMVVGGQRLYAEALRYGAQKLYLTIVKTNGEGDVVFPVTGKTLLEDKFTTKNGAIYECTKRSGWLTENGQSFQFVEFTLKNPQVEKNDD